ncbi:complement factor D-like [Scleropages formosus]|uniref:Complement factor D (adipsin) n=1 Tax=Scleropages formosus TaxID=113540 RepID=A0A8C9TRE3_SCLFO|nr:complement factor D-like [Scleropages formosus]
MRFRGGPLLVLVTIASLFFYLGECITGGNEAAPHSRPYMASIQKNGRHECGGFLVKEQWLMSAAHCFREGTEGVKIVLGAHSLKEPEQSKQEFTISELHSHPDFNTDNYDSDIALVKLDRPAVLSDAVKTLELQQAGGREPQPEEEVSAAGWGSTNNRGSRPDKLQEVFVEVMLPTLCCRSDYYSTKFTANMMCAARRQKDTCDGDSGGPLLYKGVAVGVTSNGGKKCGTSRKPGVYTIISKFTAWINKIIQG